MTEQWKPIPDFPDYEVSNTGQVRSYKRSKPHILKPAKDPNGYRRVLLRRNGKTHNNRVGWLVLSAFQGPCPEDCEMCHNDGNPANDHLDNLRWDTHAANMQDAARHKVINLIESQEPAAINNSAFIDAVMMTQKNMGISQMEFSEYLGITQSALSKLYKRGVRDSVPIKILCKFPALISYFPY